MMGAAIDTLTFDERLLRRVAAPPAGVRPGALGLILRAADFLALYGAWFAAVQWRPHPSGASAWAVALIASILGMLLIKRQGLHLARVATMRTVEHARLLQACASLLVVGVIASSSEVLSVPLPAIALGSAASFVSLLLVRSVYRAFLSAARASGLHTHPVVVVGIDDNAAEIMHVLGDHPELGFTVAGAVGAKQRANEFGLGDLWLGDLPTALAAVEDCGATGAIISASALDQDTVNAVTRELVDAGCHVHISAGIRGLDQRRLRSVHLGYEPLLYVEHRETSGRSEAVKRLLDVALASVGLLVSLPVLVASAIAIKLEDRGPVLFRQERVGRDGELFTLLKLRTMCEGAEGLFVDLLADNARHGPLFKMDDDPRVTRVGRFLRALSIDELPQLWNVLRGEMSIVGPRPALACESEAFDERLRQRNAVLPGITGLWQVEARDNPSFHAYQRLDLFYVENWSLALDLMIIVATFESELGRALRRVLGRSRAARLRIAS